MTKIPGNPLVGKHGIKSASKPVITIHKILSLAVNAGWRRWNAGRCGSMQVHSQLTLVCRAGQSQLILVENGADCRSERFRLQVVTLISIQPWKLPGNMTASIQGSYRWLLRMV